MDYRQSLLFKRSRLIEAKETAWKNFNEAAGALDLIDILIEEFDASSKQSAVQEDVSAKEAGRPEPVAVGGLDERGELQEPAGEKNGETKETEKIQEEPIETIIF